MNSKIELTNIKPFAKRSTIRQLCIDAADNAVRSVVVNPEWVEYAKLTLKRLGRSDIKVVQVYRFPTSTSTLMDGDEVDVYIRIVGITKSPYTKAFIAKKLDLIFAEIEHKLGCRSKIKAVIETRLLSAEEVIAISKMLCKLKVGYIKSSTGLFDRTNDRSNLQDLELIKKGVKIFGIPRKWFGLYQPKIKISGGIRTKLDGLKLISTGADLLGTSSILK